MSGKSDRDWFDISARLILPLVIALTGAWYTRENDASNRRQQEWDLASSYLKMLASQNEDERALGMKIIRVLQSQKRFPQELNPPAEELATGIAKGNSSVPGKWDAKAFLGKLRQSNSQLSPAQSGKFSVHVVIGRTDQKESGNKVWIKMRDLGYITPPVESVQSPTHNTYIRYFAKDRHPDAEKIQKAMQELGFPAKLQDFTDDPDVQGEPDALEVWLGTDKVSDSRVHGR